MTPRREKIPLKKPQPVNTGPLISPSSLFRAWLEFRGVEGPSQGCCVFVNFDVPFLFW